MSNKKDGLIKKYNVERVDGKPVEDAIVLEFKDPISRVGIMSWALEMSKSGYFKCADDVFQKLGKFGDSYDETPLYCEDCEEFKLEEFRQQEYVNSLENLVIFLAKFADAAINTRLKSISERNPVRAKDIIKLEFPIVQGLKNQQDIQSIAKMNVDKEKLGFAVNSLILKYDL